MLKNVMASYELTVSNITAEKLVVTLNCLDTTYNFNQVLRNRVNSNEKFERKQYEIVLFSDNQWGSIYQMDEIDMKDHRNIMNFVFMSKLIGLNKEVPHTVVVCYCKVSPAKQTEIVFEVERISINDQRKIEKKIQQAHHQQSLIEAAKIDSEIAKLKSKKKKIEDQMKPVSRKRYNENLSKLANQDAYETNLMVVSSERVASEQNGRNAGDGHVQDLQSGGDG